MKIRLGFVSNSSSSSFTCNICGHTESGWDLPLSEAGFIECSNYHIFCEEHVKYDNTEIHISYLKENSDNEEEIKKIEKLEESEDY